MMVTGTHAGKGDVAQESKSFQVFGRNIVRFYDGNANIVDIVVHSLVVAPIGCRATLKHKPKKKAMETRGGSM